MVGSHLDPQLKRVPKREDKRPRSRIPVRVIATSNKADQVVSTKTARCHVFTNVIMNNQDKEEETIEETYASHGNFSKEDPKLTDGLTLNDRFEENPQAYFEEKVGGNQSRRDVPGEFYTWFVLALGHDCGLQEGLVPAL